MIPIFQNIYNRPQDAPILYQKTQIGDLNLVLHPKECTVLKLKFAPKEMMMELWLELWDGISDYDLLPAGCQTLMASVVKKIQLLEIEEEWKQVNGMDLNFLSGLPRFVWAKNKTMQNQTIRLAEYVKNSGIEIVAINGTAELLSGDQAEIIQTISNIDLLIKPDDLGLFIQKMSEIGYSLVDKNNGLLKIINFLPKDGYQFRSNSSFLLDINVHLLVEKYYEDNQLTVSVWSSKVQSIYSDNLFIPSKRERFFISLINTYRIGNWYSGIYLKYLSDSLNHLDLMDQKNIDGIWNPYAELFKNKDWVDQIIQMGAHFGKIDAKMFSRLKKIQNSSKATLILATPSNNFLLKNIFNALPFNKQSVFLININIYNYCWKLSRKSIVNLAFYHSIKFILSMGNLAAGIIDRFKLNKNSKHLVTPIGNVKLVLQHQK
jgi:hypothetical protein